MLGRPRIRQLTLGELLDEAFRMYRRDLLTLIAIVALVLVPYTILSVLITLPLQQNIAQLQNDTLLGTTPNEQVFSGFFSSLIFRGLSVVGLGLLSTVVFTPLMEGALTHTVIRRYLDQPVSIGDSIGAALRRALPLIVAKLLPSIGLIVVSFIFIFCGVFAIGGVAAGSVAALNNSSGNVSPATGAGTVLLIVLLGFGLGLGFLALLAFLYVRFLFTSQAVMAEDKGPIDAIGRSWNLTKGYFWRTFGIFLLIALLASLIQLVPSTILGVLTGAFTLRRSSASTLVTRTVLSTVISAITSLLVTPFTLSAYTLMYYDLRIRKEGFDLEQQVRALSPDANTGYTQPFNP